MTIRSPKSGRDEGDLAKSWEREQPKRGRKTFVLFAVFVLIVVTFVVAQLLRAVPVPKATASLPKSAVVSGAPTLPWPAAGQADVAVDGVGTFLQPGKATPVPIASLAKMMTALVLLSDHPLGVAQQGPSLTVTPSDVSLYQAELAQQDSVAAVTSGEVLSERQALQALLLPSADNIAVLLARWDAGSESAFVAKMNAMAKKMGLSNTHYADTSGLDPASVSTAADQLVVAQKAMANRTIANTVALKQATLPVAGVVYNVDYVLGKDGIVGIKTGSDGPAGGCFAFLARVAVAGQTRNVYGVVLGQQGTQGGVGMLFAAFDASIKLIKAVQTQIHPVQVLAAGSRVGTVHSPWGHPIPTVTSGPLNMLGAPGMEVSLRVRPSALGSKGLAKDSQVALLVANSAGQIVTTPIKAARAMNKPSLFWRLSRL